MKARKNEGVAETKFRPAAQLHPIGVIRSRLKERTKAPKQGSEGAPDVWLDVRPSSAQGLDGLAVGDEIIVLTCSVSVERRALAKMSAIVESQSPSP